MGDWAEERGENRKAVIIDHICSFFRFGLLGFGARAFGNTFIPHYGEGALTLYLALLYFLLPFSLACFQVRSYTQPETHHALPCIRVKEKEKKPTVYDST